MSANYQSMAQFPFSQNQGSGRAAYLSWLKYQQTKNEGGNLKKWWREESAIGITFSAAAYTIHSHHDSEFYSKAPAYDSLVRGKAIPQVGIHLNGNTNHLLKRLSSASILSFSAGMQVDILRWKFENFNENSRVLTSEPLVYAQFGVPLTLDYKWGCDVDFDPYQKGCFALGAGGMPIVAGSFGANATEVNLRIAPYVYASFGFYAWGCWKIRASYMPGNYTIFRDLKTQYGQTTNILNMEGNNVIAIGISHMSYSKDWGKGNGWRGAGLRGRGRRHRSFENTRLF